MTKLFDFRHEYRIREDAYSDGYHKFYIEWKRWYWPFWKKFEVLDFFAISEFQLYEFVYNSFDSAEEAEEKAREFAEFGRSAFIKHIVRKPPIYLGRLP